MMDFLSELFRIAQVVFGIGLVIFVHEGGHFIAARLCKVRVEVFSLGFGPKIFGWRRGHTLYQIAAVPIGGYVKMAGDELERSHDGKPQEWELSSKSVPARFFIYSGGVLMNVAFALVVFPFVLANGLPSLRPMVGTLIPGSPAWHARFPIGSEVLSVNGNDVFDFFHIPNEVALSGSDPAVFTVQVPGESTPRNITLTPTYVDSPGVYQVGIGPSIDPSLAIAVTPDSPASRVGMQAGDRVVGVDGGLPGMSIEDQLHMALRTGETVSLQLARGYADAELLHVTIDPETEVLEDLRRFGVEVAQIHVSAIRK
ncbi:MAG: regulator of sigma E protease, partial [Planctomycetota bacterium]